MFLQGLEATICKKVKLEAQYLAAVDWEAHETVIRSYAPIVGTNAFQL